MIANDKCQESFIKTLETNCLSLTDKDKSNVIRNTFALILFDYLSKLNIKLALGITKCHFIKSGR